MGGGRKTCAVCGRLGHLSKTCRDPRAGPACPDCLRRGGAHDSRCAIRIQIAILPWLPSPLAQALGRACRRHGWTVRELVEAALVAHLEAIEGPGLEPSARNGWPGGPRRLPCLRCTQPMMSTGRDHRLCPVCRAMA